MARIAKSPGNPAATLLIALLIMPTGRALGSLEQRLEHLPQGSEADSVQLASSALSAPDRSAVPPTATAPAPIAQAPSPQADGVRISGASLANLTQTLEQAFKQKFPQTSLNLSTDSTDAALKKLADGEIDLAAIGRPLTAAEEQAGLVATPIARNKIAIVVGKDNAFNGSLTDVQFARIFRGEITNWADVGGRNGAIRFIDRPAQDDLRQALRSYPVFKTAPFQTGPTATTLDNPTPAGLVTNLGKNGVSYAIADQVLQNPSLKLVPMHKTLPTDARYPFSQPLLYVHKGNPSPEVKAFLDFAQDPANQALIEQARVANAASPTTSPVSESGSASSNSPVPAGSASSTAGDAVSSPAPEAGSTSPAGSVTAANPASAPRPTVVPWWPWLALPLLGGLLWGGLKRRQPVSQPTGQLGLGPTQGSLPQPVPPSSTQSPSTPSLSTNGSTQSLAAGSSVYGSTAATGSGAASSGAGAPGQATPGSTLGLTSGSTNSHTADLPLQSSPITSAPITSVPTTSVEGSTSPTAHAMGANSGNLETEEPQAANAVAQGGSQLAEPFLAQTADFGGTAVGLAGDALDQNRDCRIILVPHAADRAYVYWELSPDQRAALQQDGQKLMMRIHDVTHIDIDYDPPHDTQEYTCDETQQDMHVLLPVDQRDYLAELGYRSSDQRWLRLARSAPIRISEGQLV